MMDKKIVAEIDQKVIDQQNTLEKAGVPGFFITTNPQVSPLFNKNEYNVLLVVEIVAYNTSGGVALKCHFVADKCPADGNVYPGKSLLNFYMFCLCVCLFFQELTMQMNLLELILKLQQKESQSGVL